MKAALIGIHIFFFLISMSINAQTPDVKDYFVGKWNVLVLGTPEGDSNLIITLERKEGKLTGTIVFKGTDEVKISSIVELDNSINIYFTANGFDVNLTLEQKDEVNVSGSLLSMFDAKGTRVKVE